MFHVAVWGRSPTTSVVGRFRMAMEARTVLGLLAMGTVCSALIRSSKPVHDLWPPVVLNHPQWLWRDHASFVVQELFFVGAATVIWLLHRGNCTPQNRVLFWTCVIRSWLKVKRIWQRLDVVR